MNNKLCFCEECRDDKKFNICEKELQGEIKNKHYRYIGKVAYCEACESQVYVGDLNDYNLKQLYNKFRDENGIISLAIVIEILDKYDIGKRPLSLLLGWGEQTYTRYCEGDIPSKQYSDILLKLYNEPDYYDEILESNKSNFKSEKPYNKSKKAVRSILSKTKTEDTKINLIIGYILSESADITPLALQKVLYYVQGFYFAFTQNFIFEDECEAWIHGPVYREVYYKYKDYKFDPIQENEVIFKGEFTPIEKAVLDSVIKNICCYSGKVLECFTHMESPWLLTRGGLLNNEYSKQVISKNMIGDYFVSVKQKYNMITPNNIASYTDALFKLL